MKKRLFASFLSLCVAMTLLPTVVFASASDKAIVPGTSGITGYDAKNSYDYIYYGQWEDAPLKWRVLDDQTNTGEEGLFVLSEDCLGTGNWGDIVFDDTSPVSNAWQGSDAQTWCNTLLTNNLTPGEQGAVLDTTKSDEAYDSAQESFSASDVLGNGAVSYDSATHTLTLNNATLNPGADATAISVGEFAQGFTIRLQGTNTITSNGLAVDSTSSLIIQGTQEGSQSIHCQFCDATKVDAKAPTCTEAGNREYWYCEVCGAVLEQGKAIAKVAHHYENGVCTACGAADPNAPKPTPTPTPAPKPTQTPNPDQPQTGEANQVVVWMVVLTLSGCMAAGLALLSQRKRS